MAARPLLTLHEVLLPLQGGGTWGPIDWILREKARVWIEGATEEQADVLTGLFSGKIKPAGGYMEELRTVVFQSDGLLRETLPPNRTIGEFIASPDAPAFIWLEGRRRSFRVLVDRLGLAPNNLRRPIKLESAEVVLKYLALRFLVSRADVLMGRELFATKDEQVREVLRLAWKDFPGALVAPVSAENLPGDPDCHIRVLPGGKVEVRTPAEP